MHPDRRDQVKAVQFGLIYGAGAGSLAGKLGIPYEEVQRLVEGYFAQFPAVRAFIDDAHARVRRDGFLDDAFGRRHQPPDALLQPPARATTG